MPITWLDEIDPNELSEKRVLLRVDFNVPMDEQGRILDSQRIELAFPTIRRLLDAKAKVIVLSHLGRPKGKPKANLSLEPVASFLRDLINEDITFVHDCVGDGVARLVENTPSGSLVFLENVRFHPGEENNDPVFSKMLAKNMDIYVNDAFSASHRAHASVDGVVKYFIKPLGGLLLKKEITAFKSLLSHPKKPFVAVIGGAKVSSKIGVLLNLLKKVDALLIGGAMAYTLLAAKGHNVGKSLIEPDKIGVAENLLKRACDMGVAIHLPCDHVVYSDAQKNDGARVIDAGHFGDDDIGMDIGPKTRDNFAQIIHDAATIFCNGPMGRFEDEAFSHGTFSVLESIATSQGFSVVGGGDSIAALNKAGLYKKIGFVSSGGGASLELIEGKSLPGLLALGYYDMHR